MSLKMVHLHSIRWPDGIEIGVFENHTDRDDVIEKFTGMWNSDPEMLELGKPPISKLDILVNADQTFEQTREYVHKAVRNLLIRTAVEGFLHDMFCPCMDHEQEEERD